MIYIVAEKKPANLALSKNHLLTHAIHVQSMHVSLGCNVVNKMHMVIS